MPKYFIPPTLKKDYFHVLWSDLEVKNLRVLFNSSQKTLWSFQFHLFNLKLKKFSFFCYPYGKKLSLRILCFIHRFNKVFPFLGCVTDLGRTMTPRCT